MTVLGIDPGRDKCGLAVCEPGKVLARAIVPPSDVPRRVLAWAAERGIDAIVVGGGTGSRQVIAALAGLAASGRLPDIASEEERDSTLTARRRYFEDHPPRGWRRFVPRSFQVPAEPYDDYAAVVIAERYLARKLSNI
ncbi:MAG TPA: pre-16S rRNA-processing nuclease YqgF [bacterium]|nr:pre-16S rRNA-processing nuclease YqgF [bacterium]